MCVSRFNISSETTGPIEAKFHMELLWDGGMKFYSNGPGHMTNMAAMPIYGKNLKKSSPLEPKGWWHWKLLCSIGYRSTTKFVQKMTWAWPWPMLWQGQIWSLILLFGEKSKTMGFSETIVVYDIKVGICSQLNECTSLYSLTLMQGHSIQHFQTSFP